jgi:hypothetical protein
MCHESLNSPAFAEQMFLKQTQSSQAKCVKTLENNSILNIVLLYISEGRDRD